MEGDSEHRMCRIAGFWDFNYKGEYSLEEVAINMRDSLAYGGPDDAGVYLEPMTGLALTHRRFSILDLSPAGHQPMEFENFAITYNREVYKFLQKESTKPLKTFTIGFYEKDYNEAEHAKRIANYLGTDHTELYCTPKEAYEIIPNFPEIYDEPFGDSSAIPTYLVSKLAKSQVKVSLSADGGDEQFCGYIVLWRLRGC